MTNYGWISKFKLSMEASEQNALSIMLKFLKTKNLNTKNNLFENHFSQL